MSSHRLPDDFNRFLATSGNVIADPGASGTFDLAACPMFGLATIASGTRKLPDNMPAGTVFSVYATGAVTITTQAAVTMATLVDGQIAVFTARTATTWSVSILANSSTGRSGFIPLPLTGWREVTTNDITNAAGNGGVLATDTTPTLEYANGDTDSQIRVLWAGGNADPLAIQITLPPDLDRTQPIVLNFRGVMGGENDAPAMDVDTFFNEGDTKVEDATDAWDNSISTRTATIAVADIPSTAATMSIEITPGTHATDSMVLYAAFVTYTKNY
jgi:hypothetical protein